MHRFLLSCPLKYIAITIKFHDTYADVAERGLYDDGAARPISVQRVDEYVEA